MNLECYIGKQTQWDVHLTRNGADLGPFPDGTKFWFTVKTAPGGPDNTAVFQLTQASGITIPQPSWIRIKATVEQTAALIEGVTYVADVQYQIPGEDPDIPDGGHGTLLALLPVTTSNT